MKRPPLVQTLTLEDVLQIHEILVRDFSATGDPISPPGVRSIDLLASAVSRQDTGIGSTLKYPDAYSNAASLLYGLTNDHPFHNGNKRTALVSMLAHLHRNRVSLLEVNQQDLYRMVVEVASHSIIRPDKRRKGDGQRHDPDLEVVAVGSWLEKRARPMEVGERQITFRQLRHLLEACGYGLSSPQKNSIDVVRYETIKVGFLRKTEKVVPKRIGNIGYPGDNKFVPIGTLKMVRRICLLTEEYGMDSRSFYDQEAIVDAFVAKYSRILKKLAKR